MNEKCVTKTLVIVVTFNPEWRAVFNSIVSNINVHDIFISDNSDESNDSLVAELLADKDKSRVIYHYNGGNVGIAAAQNAAINFAISRGYNYVFFSDDDSSFNDGIIGKLIDSSSKLLLEGTKLAAICATPLERGGMDKTDRINEQFSSVRNLMSSGSLCPVHVFSVVGLFDEELFIDYVDYEWGWRSLKMGFELFIDTSILFSHRLGMGRLDLPLFMRLGVPSPIRHFYQTRNLLRLCLLSYVPLSWKLLQVMLLPIRFAIFGFLYSDSRKRRGYFIQGFLAAFSK